MTRLSIQLRREAHADTSCEARPADAGETEASRAALTRIMQAAGTSVPMPPSPSPSPLPSGTLTAARIAGAGPAAGDWRIAVPGGAMLNARTALSCIVQPQPGDLVQLYVDHDRSWVLAILERDAGAPSLTLDFGAADVLLQAQGLRLHARDRMTLEAAHLASRAGVITEAAAERQAHIGGTDATHAGNTLVHTERHMGLHATSTTITSASLLKIDGGQIHMG